MLAGSGLSQNQIEGMGCSRGDRHINPSGFTLRGDNMQTVQCDEKGRLELSQAVRSRYGEKFLVLEGRKELILRPIPRDPLQDLREIGRLLKGKSVRELKEAIEQQAMEEVGG